MNPALTRALMVLLALGCATAVVVAAFLVVIGALGCEDAEDAAFATVRCDSERGGGWQAVQLVLVIGTLLALLVGLVFSLARLEWLPLGIPAALTVPLMFAVVQIGDIEVPDRRVPKLSDVRVLESTCRHPCAEGFPLRFRLDTDAEVDVSMGPARFEDIGGRQYASGFVGHPVEPGGAGVELGSGAHVERGTGRIVNPPRQAGPLPPGSYELSLTARPVDAGNQEDATRESAKFRVRIVR